MDAPAPPANHRARALRVGALRQDFDCGLTCGFRRSRRAAGLRSRDRSGDAARPALSRGLGGWAAWGAAPYEHGNDGLHVRATAAQDAATNSPRFAVTPGAAYTATFVARIAPASLGGGYFSIIFTDGQSELTRQLLPLTAAAVPLGSTRADADGRYQLPLALDGLPEVILRASYAGDADHWPARSEALVGHVVP